MKKVFIFIKKIFTKELTDEQCQYIDVICGHIFLVNLAMVIPLMFIHFKPVRWYGPIFSIGMTCSIAYSLSRLKSPHKPFKYGNYLWFQFVYYTIFSIFIPIFVWAIVFKNFPNFFRSEVF